MTGQYQQTFPTFFGQAMGDGREPFSYRRQLATELWPVFENIASWPSVCGCLVSSENQFDSL